MYKVIITNIKEETTKSQRWLRLFDSDSPKAKEGAEQYGYVTTVETNTVSTPIYEQSIEILDLEAVIKAVNQID